MKAFTDVPRVAQPVSTEVVSSHTTKKVLRDLEGLLYRAGLVFDFLCESELTPRPLHPIPLARFHGRRLAGKLQPTAGHREAGQSLYGRRVQGWCGEW